MALLKIIGAICAAPIVVFVGLRFWGHLPQLGTGVGVRRGGAESFRSAVAAAKARPYINRCRKR